MHLCLYSPTVLKNILCLFFQDFVNGKATHFWLAKPYGLAYQKFCYFLKFRSKDKKKKNRKNKTKNLRKNGWFIRTQDVVLKLFLNNYSAKFNVMPSKAAEDRQVEPTRRNSADSVPTSNLVCIKEHSEHIGQFYESSLGCMPTDFFRKQQQQPNNICGKSPERLDSRNIH